MELMKQNEEIESTFVFIELLSDENSAKINKMNFAFNKTESCQIYHEIINTCKHKNTSVEVILEIMEYLQKILNLSKSDIVEFESNRKADEIKFDRLQTYCKLMTIQMEAKTQVSQNVMNELLSEEVFMLFTQSLSFSDSRILYAKWLAAVLAYHVTAKNLSVLNDILDQIILHRGNKRQKNLVTVNDDKIEKEFWNGNEKLFEKFADYIATSLHLTILDDESRMNKIKSFEDIFKIGRKIENFSSFVINFNQMLKKSIQISTERKIDESINERTLCRSSDDEIRLNSLLRLIKCSKTQYGEIVVIYTNALNGFELDKTLYHIYECKLMKIIKPRVLEAFKNLQNEINIPVVIAAYKLFDELTKFMQYGMKNFNFSHLNQQNFSKWFFEPAFEKILNHEEKITRAILLDHKEHDKYEASSSAIDLRDLITGVYIFWTHPKWPLNRNSEILEFIAKHISQLTNFYIEKYFEHSVSLQKSMCYHQALVKMTETVINFNFTSKVLQDLLIKLNSKFNDQELGKAKEVYRKTFILINGQVNSLIDSSIETIESSLSNSIKTATESEAIMTEFFDEFRQTLSEIEANLNKLRLKTFKSHLWTKINELMPKILQHLIDKELTKISFINLKTIWLLFKNLFSLSDEHEEANEAVKNYEELLEWYCMDSTELIYHEYEIQKKTITQTATATVICYFEENILKLEILHAQKINLVCPDDGKFFIQFKVFSELSTSATRKWHKTEEKNDHYPLYDFSFELMLDEEERTQVDGILFFKLKRANLIGFKTTLGEGFLRIREIPKNLKTPKDGEAKKFLRKEILFLKVANSDNLPLKILKHRRNSSDNLTKKFVSKIEARSGDA